MIVHRNHIVIRIVGTLVAFGFLATGLFAIFAAAPDLPEVNRDRSFWFGITCIIAFPIAAVLSWVIRDVRGVWCAPPPRRIFDD